MGSLNFSIIFIYWGRGHCVPLHVWRSEDTLQESVWAVHHVGSVIYLRLLGLQEPLPAGPSCHPAMFLFLLFCFKFKEQDIQAGVWSAFPVGGLRQSCLPMSTRLKNSMSQQQYRFTPTAVTPNSSSSPRLSEALGCGHCQHCRGC